MFDFFLANAVGVSRCPVVLAVYGKDTGFKSNTERLMVRSIHAHRHIKSLCRFFGSMRSTFEVLDGDTIAVTSGNFCGLKFAFEPGLCKVSDECCCTCFDVTGDFSAEALILMLLKHRIIHHADWSA